MSKRKFFRTMMVIMAMMMLVCVPATALAGSGDDQIGNSSGSMPRNRWVKSEGMWFYHDANSNLLYETWAKIGGKWYYFFSGGAMATGWIMDDYTSYYMGTDGAMRTGWFKVAGKWYYADRSGAMLRDEWVKSGGKWYYVDSIGIMCYSQWMEIDGKWYFFRSTGVMGVGVINIDGTRHRFGNDGAWLGLA